MFSTLRLVARAAFELASDFLAASVLAGLFGALVMGVSTPRAGMLAAALATPILMALAMAVRDDD